MQLPEQRDSEDASFAILKIIHLQNDTLPHRPPLLLIK